MDNKTWSENIINKYSPAFKHRWEVYDEIIKNNLSKEKIWIDCGCGNNGMIEHLGKLASKAIGVDIVDIKNKNNYVKANIKKLPFSSGYADLVTLRFVVEHFEIEAEYIKELSRVLKKGGIMIILTTNLLSPFIFLPRLLLPYSIKSKILTKLFRVKDDDVFPTYHKINTPKKFKKLGKYFKIDEMIFISDLNYTRKWVFIILLAWHKITERKFLNKFRTNILVVLKKK